MKSEDRFLVEIIPGGTKPDRRALTDFKRTIN